MSKDEKIGSREILLVGRVEELDVLKEQLDNVERGKGARVVLISGEAGIGKTRLANEFMLIAAERGFKVLQGKCIHESLTPYLPMFEALREGNLGHLISFETPPKVEYVFLMSPGGLPVGWLERKETDIDMDIFSGMLSAVSTFMKDSIMKLTKGEIRESTFQTIGYGDYRIIIETRTFGSLIIILTGKETEILKGDMNSFMERIEKDYRFVLDGWDGDPSKVEPIKPMLRTFFEKYDGIDHVKEPKNKQWRLFENVSKGLNRLSREGPVLLFFDDLQWMDPGSSSILLSVIRKCLDQNLLVVGTYRPEGIEDTDGQEHPLKSFRRSLVKEGLIKEVALGRFNYGTVLSLLAEDIGSVARGAIGELIARESQGNPFIALELANFLKTDGTLELVDGNWESNQPVEKIGLPRKIKDAILARISILPPEHKDILECAAVMGEIFRSDIVECVLKRDKLKVLKALRDIEQVHRLVFPSTGQNRFRFDHVKIQEVLYTELPEDLRVEYHRVITACLMCAIDEGKKVDLPELAIHAYSAHHQNAVDLCRQAGDALRSSFNNDEARRFYKMALERCDGEERTDLFEALGEVEYQAGKFEESMGLFEEASRYTKERDRKVYLAARQGRALDRLGRQQEAIKTLEEHPPDDGTSPLVAARWRSTMAWFRFRLMDYEGAREDAKEAIKVFEAQGGSGADIADCWNTLGGLEHDRGRYSKAIENFKKGLSAAESSEDPFQTVRILGNLSLCESCLGHLKKSLELDEKNLITAERSGNLFSSVFILQGIGERKKCMGRFSEAYESLTRAIARSDEIEAPRLRAEILRDRAACLLELGRIDDAERDIQGSLQFGEDTGSGRLMTYLVDSEVQIAKGNITDAIDIAKRAVDGFRQSGSRKWLGEALRNLALANFLNGAREEAEEAFHEALEDNGEYMELFEYARGLRWWGEALREWGEKEKAGEKLEAARKRFKDMGAEVELVRVENELKELGEQVT